MGALLTAIEAQISTLRATKLAVAVRAENEQNEIDAALVTLAATQKKLTDDPELETLFASVQALNILPATRRTT